MAVFRRESRFSRRCVTSVTAAIPLTPRFPQTEPPVTGKVTPFFPVCPGRATKGSLQAIDVTYIGRHLALVRASVTPRACVTLDPYRPRCVRLLECCICSMYSSPDAHQRSNVIKAVYNSQVCKPFMVVSENHSLNLHRDLILSKYVYNIIWDRYIIWYNRADLIRI